MFRFSNLLAIAAAAALSTRNECDVEMKASVRLITLIVIIVTTANEKFCVLIENNALGSLSNYVRTYIFVN